MNFLDDPEAQKIWHQFLTLQLSWVLHPSDQTRTPWTHDVGYHLHKTSEPDGFRMPLEELFFRSKPVSWWFRCRATTDRKRPGGSPRLFSGDLGLTLLELGSLGSLVAAAFLVPPEKANVKGSWTLKELAGFLCAKAVAEWCSGLFFYFYFLTLYNYIQYIQYTSLYI